MSFQHVLKSFKVNFSLLSDEEIPAGLPKVCEQAEVVVAIDGVSTILAQSPQPSLLTGERVAPLSIPRDGLRAHETVEPETA